MDVDGQHKYFTLPSEIIHAGLGKTDLFELQMMCPIHIQIVYPPNKTEYIRVCDAFGIPVTRTVHVAPGATIPHVHDVHTLHVGPSMTNDNDNDLPLSQVVTETPTKPKKDNSEHDLPIDDSVLNSEHDDNDTLNTEHDDMPDLVSDSDKDDDDSDIPSVKMDIYDV